MSTDKLEVLVQQLLDKCEPDSFTYGLSDKERERWERNIKGILAQVFFQGIDAGWEKVVAVPCSRRHIVPVDEKEDCW